MTKPPCFKGEQCEKRVVGCHAKCPEWAEWEKIHEAELSQIREAKAEHSSATGFLIDLPRRNKNYVQEQYQRRSRKK